MVLTVRKIVVIIYSFYSKKDTMIKFTRRQQEFLGHFLDLYQELNVPIHYTEVAKRLGVGRITAYEMLRLLEERGLVLSEFYLPEGKRGPGRAIVLFAPTEKALQLMVELAGDTVNLEDWEQTKAHIMERLRQGKLVGYEALLNELLTRVPDNNNSPLLYMAEMTTTMILAVRTYMEGPGGQVIKEHLRRIGLPGELGLSALSGMGMALGAMELVNRRIAIFLLRESSKYQLMYVELTEENRRRLGNLAREAFQIIYE